MKTLNRLLISSGLIGLAGSIYQIILPLFLYEATKSQAAMANLRGFEFVPNIMLAPIVGAIIDRVSKKRAHFSAVAAQVLGLCGLALASLWLQGIFLTFFIYAFVFLLMTANYVNDNVRMTLIKMHVPMGELGTANSRMVSVWTIANFIAPVMAPAMLSYDVAPI